MKTVLITGASSGIGQQLALDYANQGWQVYACGQNQQRLQQLVMEVAPTAVGNITPLIFDVTDANQTQQVLLQLDVLPELIILNAGTCEYIDDGVIDSGLFKRVFEVNFFGILHCLEAIQDRFTAATHLVFISSSAAYTALPRAEAYGASKAALSYFSNGLAIDLKQKVKAVTLVNPGFVATPLTNKNDFPMPMIVSCEYASDKIRHGIRNQQAEIHFPKKFTLLLKAIALLPIAAQRVIIQQMTRKAS
ncbi:KR domain-containing protein [Photobacterium aquimaris]|uniref:KR domain-containing protein n=1 Tax=Photobacterium aquimaris TaxID=512643 RepID=A0A2T3INQ0_9GAMM|nr:SDR family NAD(P)-dependent oxidoreductase [Photobacterium aquimaris]OBU22298.1 short-chain dehydrogenase [Photobacterium aquimaris]PSU29969.1 KR domain-containing protein [Photobacterium aquimaris]